MHLHRHQHAQVTRVSARTRPVHEPAPSFSPLAGPSILRPPPQPRPSAVPHGPLLCLRLHNLHHHNRLLHHYHHHVLIQHATPQTAGETSLTGDQTRPHREQPSRRQVTPPDEARARSPAETKDRHRAAAQTCRRAAAATCSQTQAQAQAWRHDGSAGPTPRGRPL